MREACGRFVEAQSALVQSNERGNGSLYVQLEAKRWVRECDRSLFRQLYEEKRS
jgi:hypothetical protein